MDDTSPEGEILDGDHLRVELEKILPGSKKNVILISAYVTEPGINWLFQYTPKNIDRHIICRLLPFDVQMGSTQISALQKAINGGIKVSCLPSLHAKIYSIDDRDIYVGSANLTGSGLTTSGLGNLEACSKVSASKENLAFIRKIVLDSNELDMDTLNSMQEIIPEKRLLSSCQDEWPSGLIKAKDGIWVRDFLWNNIQDIDSYERDLHDLHLIGIESFDVERKYIEERLIKTRCVKWLLQKLSDTSNQQLYFGEVSALLHTELRDDPSPYRRDVKSLVQNLFSYCEKYLPMKFRISRPNHSQKIELL
jgi:hypothetical protein